MPVAFCSVLWENADHEDQHVFVELERRVNMAVSVQGKKGSQCFNEMLKDVQI